MNAIELTKALPLNYINIKIPKQIDIPTDLWRFHTDLNVYIYYLLSSSESQLHSELENVQLVINTLTNYHKELNWNYNDSPSDMKSKLEVAEKEVITPFLEGSSNPF